MRFSVCGKSSIQSVEIHTENRKTLEKQNVV